MNIWLNIYKFVKLLFYLFILFLLIAWLYFK